VDILNEVHQYNKHEGDGSFSTDFVIQAPDAFYVHLAILIYTLFYNWFDLEYYAYFHILPIRA
jgi:hypothetical protein